MAGWLRGLVCGASAAAAANAGGTAQWAVCAAGALCALRHGLPASGARRRSATRHGGVGNVGSGTAPARYTVFRPLQLTFGVQAAAAPALNAAKMRCRPGRAVATRGAQRRSSARARQRYGCHCTWKEVEEGVWRVRIVFSLQWAAPGGVAAWAGHDVHVVHLRACCVRHC